MPATGGAIICSNHVSFFDFTFLGLGALPQHRLVRFMAKASVFDHWFAGRFMRAMQHIPVDRKAGAAAFEAAVRALKDGEVVGVFPEATISTSFTVKDLKAGAARMAVQSGVPIIPAAVWGGHRVATKGQRAPAPRRRRSRCILGEPIVAEPGEKAQSLLRRTRAAMEELLDEAQRTYPQQPAGPDDRWWLPAAPRGHRAHAGGGGGRGRRPGRRQGAQGGQGDAGRSADGHSSADVAEPAHSTTAGAISRKASSSTSYQRRNRPSGSMPSRPQTASDAALPGRTTA